MPCDSLHPLDRASQDDSGLLLLVKYFSCPIFRKFFTAVVSPSLTKSSPCTNLRSEATTRARLSSNVSIGFQWCCVVFLSQVFCVLRSIHGSLQALDVALDFNGILRGTLDKHISLSFRRGVCTKKCEYSLGLVLQSATSCFRLLPAATVNLQGFSVGPWQSPPPPLASSSSSSVFRAVFFPHS